MGSHSLKEVMNNKEKRWERADGQEPKNRTQNQLTKIYQSTLGHRYGTHSQNFLSYSSTKSRFSKRSLALVKDPS